MEFGFCDILLACWHSFDLFIYSNTFSFYQMIDKQK